MHANFLIQLQHFFSSSWLIIRGNIGEKFSIKLSFPLFAFSALLEVWFVKFWPEASFQKGSWADNFIANTKGGKANLGMG